MTVRGETVGYILVIEGIGTTSGLTVLASFTPSSSLKTAFSAELGAAVNTVHEVLPSRISVGRASLPLFGAFSADAGFTVSFPADNTIRQLLDYDEADEWLTSDNVEVRAVDFINSGDTAITVNSNGPFSATDLIYLNDEVMEVTSTSGGDTINVSRGQLGTTASDHPATPRGTILWQVRPKIDGARCWLYYGPTDATAISTTNGDFQLRFRGVVQAIGSDSQENLSLQVGSLWERLKQRKFRAPRPALDAYSQRLTRISATEFGSPTGIVFAVDETQVGTSTWSYVSAQMVDGEGWVVLPVSQVGSTYTITDPVTQLDRQFQDYEIDGDAIAAGIGRAPVGFTLQNDELGNEWEIGQTKSVEIRRANVKTTAGGRAPSALLLTLLTGTLMGGMRTAEVDSTTFTILEDVLGVGAWSNAMGSTEAFVFPPDPDLSVGDWLKSDWFEPLGVALVVQENGTLALMDWRDSYFSDGFSVSDNTVATPRFNASKTSEHVVSMVSIETDVDPSLEIVSDVAIQTSGGGKEITVKPNSLRQYLDQIRDRWASTLLPQRGKARRSATFTIRQIGPASMESAAGAPLDVGSVVALTLARFPSKGGGVPDPRPTGTAPSLSLPSDGRGARVVEMGQGPDLERSIRVLVGPDLGDGAQWGPAATADASSTTTTVSIDTAVFTASDDAAAFEPFVGRGLMLLDGNGTRRDTNSPNLSSQSSGSLVLSARFNAGGPDLTINSGDLIMVAPLDEQASTVRTSSGTKKYGWYASQDGTVNTGSPQRYE